MVAEVCITVLLCSQLISVFFIERVLKMPLVLTLLKILLSHVFKSCDKTNEL